MSVRAHLLQPSTVTFVYRNQQITYMTYEGISLELSTTILIPG